MSRYASGHSRSPLVLVSFLSSLIIPAAVLADARVSESYGKLPLHFEANQGQAHEDVRFLSRGLGYSLYLTASEAVVVLSQPGADAQPESTALRMTLVGAARKPVVSGLEQLSGKANYFIGNDPAKWRANVPLYGKVHYREVYPGIDVVYYGNQRQLEYDFVVAPGADPNKIVLELKGADKLEIDARGDLVLHMGGESIRQKKPVIYQEVDGMRREIAGSYVRKSANRVGFKVAAYDTSRPLVIDPVLAYSTFLGNEGSRISNLAVHADGSVYVTGTSNRAVFPTTPGAFQPTRNGATNAVVAKLNPAGSALVYATYLGGSNSAIEGGDFASAIAVDATGNAYVTGRIGSPDFPTTPGAFKTTSCFGNAFVTKLDPTGTALVYSTCLGPASGSRIVVDAAGHAYVAGSTGAGAGFPTTPGAFQPSAGGGTDAFVTKLNPAGSALVYSTFLGGSGTENSGGLALDGSGSVYVTGSTNSTDFPTTPGAFQTVFSGGVSDAFVTKLDPAGSVVVYSTYLGGTGEEARVGSARIAVDTGGSAYVTGSTDSTDFPTTPGAFQVISRGSFDVFVAKLDSAGSRLIYSTYLGGSGSESLIFGGIAVDRSGNAYVTGTTGSTDFPMTADGFDTTYNGPFDQFGTDAFVSKLNPAGTGLVFSTYLGGNSTDNPGGIAVDANGNIHVAGTTHSTNFPTTPGAYDTTYCCPPPNPFTGEGFVTKITDGTPSSPAPFTGKPIAIPGTFEAENFDRGGEGVAYHDNVPGNAGGAYRSEDVDIVPSLDSAGGGFVVNNFETGEWLAYTIHVPAGGAYFLELRAATNADFPNAAYRVEIDGASVTGPVVLPNTGGWDRFQWVGKVTIQLPAGQHILKIVSDRQYFNLNQIRVTSSSGPTPHTGTPFPVPGSWTAVAFDNGGEGVAYHDNVPGNAGGQFRPDEDVDITTSGGSFVVNNFETGEWLLYTINVQTPGFYDIRLFTSSEFANSAFHVEIDDTNVTGRVTVPSTGNWNNFQWVVAKQGLRLTAGQHLLKVFADQQYFNLRDVWVVAAPTPTPFTGKPVQLPALIEAENFDNGGEGVAYHDNVPGNAGGQYRNGESVDIIASADAGLPGGFVVNNFETGEWLVYTVNSNGGLFEIDLRAATSPDFPGAAYRLEIDGVNVSGPVVLPDTGGWNNFQWVGRVLARIDPGQHVLRIVSERQYFNLNAIKVAPRPN